MTDRTAAARQRRFRERRRRGVIPLTVEVDEVGLAEALIEAGEITPAEAEDREALARGLERVLNRLLIVTA